MVSPWGGVFRIILTGGEVLSDYVAENQGQEKGEGAFEPPDKERIATHERKVKEVSQEKQQGTEEHDFL